MDACVQIRHYIDKMIKIAVVFVALLVCSAIAEETLQGDVITSSPFETKVTKGTPIAIGTWNSIGSLHRGTAAIFTHVCSCSILTVNFLLTAAQCFEPSSSTDWSNPALWRIRISTNAGASASAARQLTDFVRHPDFNPTTYENDIAVLQTTPVIVFAANTGQIILPPPGDNMAEGSMLRVAGWGTTIGGLGSPTLLEGALQIVDQQYCRDVYSHWGTNVTDHMFCTRLPLGAGNGCVGDIGGPIIANGRLYGLVSWGYGCVMGDDPGVNTQVSHYTQWIIITARSNEIPNEWSLYGP